MAATTFDTLEYFEKLTAAGMPEAQAKVQVDALQGVIKSYDEASRKDLATRGDIQAVRGEIQDMRMEMQNIHAEIAQVKHEMLKWMVSGMLAQTALLVCIMAFLK